MVSTSCKKDKKETKSSEKKVLTFQFISVTPAVTATINEATKSIVADFPVGTNVANMITGIGISDKATINPASGVAQNFTNPINYTVTAEDGSTVVYTATVTIGGASPLDPQTLSGSMSTNQTLVNRSAGIDYIIDGTFTISGNALLTIEPGVKILFTGVDGGITVKQNAGLKMVGTAADPIIFSGPINNPNIGSWYGFEINSNRADNEFSYVQFINGGSNDIYSVINLWGDAKLKISNCTISGSLGNGVGLDGASKLTTFTGNTIEKCLKNPVYAYSFESIMAINATNIFTNNTLNFIHIPGNTGIEYDATMNALSIPYYFEGGLSFNIALTIQEGTTLAFGSSTYLSVNDGGKIIANGTPTKRITFTGYSKDPGYWNCIWIETSLACKFENCDIEYGGKNTNYGALYIYDTPLITLTNNTFKFSTSYGASRMDNTNTGITAIGNTFNNCVSGNVYNRNVASISANF
ncbi:MAG: hypothetical protein AUJ97_05445 [Bacteroidetes bacterium CG2_30_32_10]|nr:MAG: hypothetical protein AUJ97_05445 [Bacteroidetes bacterium CG2_30_32_10]